MASSKVDVTVTIPITVELNWEEECDWHINWADDFYDDLYERLKATYKIQKKAKEIGTKWDNLDTKIVALATKYNVDKSYVEDELW